VGMNLRSHSLDKLRQIVSYGMDRADRRPAGWGATALPGTLARSARLPSQ
jgi:hypothetical protein